MARCEFHEVGREVNQLVVQVSANEPRSRRLVRFPHRRPSLRQIITQRLHYEGIFLAEFSGQRRDFFSGDSARMRRIEGNEVFIIHRFMVAEGGLEFHGFLDSSLGSLLLLPTHKAGGVPRPQFPHFMQKLARFGEMAPVHQHSLQQLSRDVRTCLDKRRRGSGMGAPTSDP